MNSSIRVAFPVLWTSCGFYRLKGVNKNVLDPRNYYRARKKVKIKLKYLKSKLYCIHYKSSHLNFLKFTLLRKQEYRKLIIMRMYFSKELNN